jgi:hypothetical protein
LATEEGAAMLRRMTTPFVVTSLAALSFGLAVPFLISVPANADEGPVIVIPSRPGVPVIINGVDASYAVVEGDWGLARPGAGRVTVIGGAPVLPNPVYAPRYPYLPRYGHAPPRGRLEIEPPANRRLPKPAESYFRSWSTSSDPVPATVTDPETFPQDFDPPVVVEPPRRRR